MEKHIIRIVKLLLLVAFLSRIEFVYGQPEPGAATGLAAHHMGADAANKAEVKEEAPVTLAHIRGAGSKPVAFLPSYARPGEENPESTSEAQRPDMLPPVSINDMARASTLGETIGSTGLALKASPKMFSPKTDLSFTLRQEGRYRLEVLDGEGTVVAVLAEGYGEKGEFLVYQFKNEKRSAGGYIGRLITDNEVTSTRFVLD